ncbi:OmpA family protein [Zooshikella marina]|uniref:OmpA family protein n=1 Tax=Zooshikella ganghwensis TaxID=202772 RepID=UPI001BB03520|nr:OmpA family protein [Zooshikella ganghwensis]MBU2707356.1 OmpA family protein [Zooshikella ganghwensis]
MRQLQEYARVGLIIALLGGGVVGCQKLVDGDWFKEPFAKQTAKVDANKNYSAKDNFYIDRQEESLRQALEKTKVSVSRDLDHLVLIMPEEASFAINATHIRQDFSKVLNALANVLAEFDQNTVEIIGHTDNTGDYQFNQRLSRERAREVAYHLTQRGIAASRVTFYGMGPDSPIASNDTSSGRMMNRRVEINIKPPKH